MGFGYAPTRRNQSVVPLVTRLCVQTNEAQTTQGRIPENNETRCRRKTTGAAPQPTLSLRLVFGTNRM